VPQQDVVDTDTLSTKDFTGKGGSGRVAIFNLSPGVVRYEFCASLLDVVMYEHGRAAKNARKGQEVKSAIGSVAFQTAGAVLNIYRNMMVEEFLDGEHDWMLFLDSDMVLPSDTVEKLLAVGDSDSHPIVAGLYMMAQQQGNVPTMLFWGADKSTGKYRMHPWTGFIPADTLVEVDGTGAGCLMAHRSALLKMYEHYGSPEPWYGTDIRDGTLIGEDYTFTMRAKDLGIPTFVYTGLQLGHAGKTVTLTTSMHSGPTLLGYDARIHDTPPEPQS
jgi:hypothetical protein